jgi:hypothetical protein
MDGRERKSIEEFYEVYNLAKKGRELRVHTRFTAQEGCIKIYEGIGLKKKQIVKAETEDGNWVECYRRATEALLNWEMSRKQEAKAS